MLKKVLAIAAGLSLAACDGSSSSKSGGSSGESTKALSIQGTFASLPSFVPPLFGVQIVPMATSVYKVRCVTLAGPLAAGEGTVSASAPYTFSLSMTAGLNAPIGCFLLGDDQIVATLSFGSETSMSGGSKPKTAYSPKPDSTLISLGNLNVANGFVTPTGQIEENGTGAKPGFENMTGTWTVTSVYTNEAENYVHPCDMDFDPTEEAELNTACRANWSSTGMYVHQITASNGTDSRTGIGLWDSEQAVAACGKREGVDLDTGWSETSDWEKGPFDFATLDFTNVTTAMLQQAPFRKSIKNGTSNCPKDEGGDDLPGCETATTCNDFTYPDGAVGSEQKVRCLLHALSNGGQFRYNWGTQCGARVKVNWSNVPGSIGFDDSGNGCKAGACDDIVDFSPEDAAPTTRSFFSELFVDGNVGTAAETNVWNCEGALLKEDTAITLTQSSATKATFVVEMAMSFIDGTENEREACMEDSDVATWAGKVRRMKLEMSKQ